MLGDSPNSLVDKLLFQFHEWDWMERAEDYVRTGEPLELHTAISGDEWPLYQRGMRALAGTSAGEVVLDLPEAVEHAAPILAAEGMGDRVLHRVGDALTGDLGTDVYDVIPIAQLVHHFSDEQNRELAARVARALRPGGVYAILDAVRSPSAKDAGQTGALLDFYFALTSQSGT